MRTSAAARDLCRKLISTFFAATLALGLVPVAAFAEPAAVAAESSGAADASFTTQREDESPRDEDPVITGESQDEAVATGSIPSDGEEGTEDNAATGDDAQASVPAGVINQTMPLETVAQQESTRSYFLAQTLESTKTVPIVSANLPLDKGTNQGSQAGADGGTTVGSEDRVTDGDPSASTEGDGGSEPEEGDDSDESDLGTSGGDGATPGVSSESTVVGSFTYLGMTFAVEPGGESVALMAADYAKLPSEFVENQVVVIPDIATSDGTDYYTVARIADNVFASFKEESANPDFLGAEALVNELSEEGDPAVDEERANPLEGRAGILLLGIPASIMQVEDDAFTGFDTLQYVVASEDNPTYGTYDGCLYDAELTSLLLIPEGRLGAVRIAPNTTAICPEAFSHCAVDTALVDPDSAASQLLEGIYLYNNNNEVIESVSPGRDAEMEFDSLRFDSIQYVTEPKEGGTYTGILTDAIESLDDVLVYSASNSNLNANGGSIYSTFVQGTVSNLGHNLAGGYWSFSNNVVRLYSSANVLIDTATLQTRTNCTFLGWSLGAVNPASLVKSGSYPLERGHWFANWQVLLTWNPNGGWWGANTSSTGNQTSKNNNSTTATSYNNSTLPQRTGYTFRGWSTSSSATSGSTTITVPNSPTTYYAAWQPHAYTITFDTQAEEVATPADISASYDATVTLPGPVRPGYTFKGWDTKQDGSGVRYASGAHAKLNLTADDRVQVPLYAQWELTEYAISFDPNINDADSTDLTRTFFDELPELSDIDVAAENVDGFKFAGYFDAVGKQYYASDGMRLIDMKETEGDVALYAHWKYRIYFDRNDDEARASLPEGEVQDDGSVKVTLTGGIGTESVFIHDYDTDAPYMWATWHGESAIAAYPTVYLPGASRANYPSDGSPAQSFGPLSFWTYGSGSKAAADAVLADQNALIGALTDDDIGKCVTLKADWRSAAAKYAVRLVASTPFAGTGNIDSIAAVAVSNETERTKELEDVPYGSPLAEGATAFPVVAPIPDPNQHVMFAGYYAVKNASDRDVLYIDAEGNAMSQLLDRATLVDGAVELYARWVVASYNVTFELTDADAGQDAKRPDAIRDLRYDTALPELSWEDGGIAATKVPVREGFAFRGFFDKNGIQYYDENLATLEGARWASTYDATVLYARWTYEVELDMNLGASGTLQAADSVLAADGSILKGSGTSVSSIYKVSATERTASDGYDPFAFSEDTTKCNAIPTGLVRMRGDAKTGYAFRGFTAVQDDAGTLVDETWLASAENPSALLPQNGSRAKLYALWEALPYTVVFEQAWTDGEGNRLEPVRVGTPAVYDASEAFPVRYDAPIPASFSGFAPYIEGYTFEGYFTESDGGKRYFSAGENGVVLPTASGVSTVLWTEPVDEDGEARVTLYAHYTLTAHSIAFDVAGGYADGYADGWNPSAYTTLVNLNAPLMPPGNAVAFAVPERYGYAFVGWYAQQGGKGTRYADETGAPTGAPWPTDGGGTLYAAWIPKTYKVEWMYGYTQGGVDAGVFRTVEDQVFDAPLVVPSDAPARPGYTTFAGWYTAVSGGEAVSDATLFAPDGLEDRSGALVDGGVTRYYARYDGAEKYWVKLFAGDGGRFTGDVSDSVYAPQDSWYAYGQNGAVEYPIRADRVREVQLGTPDAYKEVSPLRARLTDYAFVGWMEKTDSLVSDNGGKAEYKPIAETHPDRVYAANDPEVVRGTRVAGTLKDDKIPVEVMGNRTFVACWKSVSSRIVLELGHTSTDGAVNAGVPAFDKAVASSLGFTESASSIVKDWESPFERIDLAEVAVCTGYRLVGFVPKGHESDADAAQRATLFFETARGTAEPSDLAGTYVAIWEALPYKVMFHANYRDDRIDSAAYDTERTYAYDEQVELPYPGPSFPWVGDEGDYASYSFDYWGTDIFEVDHNVISGWRADETVVLYDILAELDRRGIEVLERTVHLYAQWVPTVNVTVPLFVSLAVDTDTEGADILVADWDGKNGDDKAFLGLQSINATPFQVHSLTCEVINEFGTGPLVSDAGGDGLSAGALFLTVKSERANGREFRFDLSDMSTTVRDGVDFDAATEGLRVGATDARIPLSFGLEFAGGKDVTDFSFADGFVVDDATSKGTLARIFYTIEAVR